MSISRTRKRCDGEGGDLLSDLMIGVVITIVSLAATIISLILIARRIAKSIVFKDDEEYRRVMKRKKRR